MLSWLGAVIGMPIIKILNNRWQPVGSQIKARSTNTPHPTGKRKWFLIGSDPPWVSDTNSGWNILDKVPNMY